MYNEKTFFIYMQLAIIHILVSICSLKLLMMQSGGPVKHSEIKEVNDTQSATMPNMVL